MTSRSSYDVEFDFQLDDQTQWRAGDWVATRIRDAIIGGRLAPGQALPLVPLAQSLGVSSTPLREALQKLGSEGVVTRAGGRTFYVAKLTLEDIRDFHRLHAFISAELAVRASRVLTSKKLDFLERLDRQIKASDDVRQMHDLNFQFHRVINTATPPSPLHRMAVTTSRYVSLRSYPEAFPWADQEGQVNHVALVRALREQDDAEIRRVFTAHVMGSCESIVAHLRRVAGWADPANTALGSGEASGSGGEP